MPTHQAPKGTRSACMGDKLESRGTYTYMTGIDPFITQAKVIIHDRTMNYNRPNVWDDPRGSAAADKFEGQVRTTYIINNLKRMNTTEGARD